jgi:hypothetical protein
VTPYVVVLKPLDVIELRVAVDSWEAGTVATVLEVAPDSVLAEVADSEGRTLEVVTVPLEAAGPVEGAARRRLRIGQPLASRSFGDTPGYGVSSP